MKYEKKVVVVDGIKFNRDQKTGYYLPTRRILDGKRYRLHVYMWIKNNGSIANGMSVHHKDENKDNNDVENLELMSKSSHSILHSNEYAHNHIEEMRENLNKNVRPKASEWHGSKEGREWHSKHGIEIVKHRTPVEAKCMCCNKEFDTYKGSGSKYCSMACASKHRRDSKLDHVIKKCVLCGNEFETNKYDKTQSCSRRCGAIYGKQQAKIRKSEVC